MKYQPKKEWWQFSMAGLFLVVTMLCVRLGMHSLGWGPQANRQVLLTVEVDRDVTPQLEKELRRRLYGVESVSLMMFRHRTVSVHVRKPAIPQVLEALREAGLNVESHNFH